MSNIPILGQTQPNHEGLTSRVEIHDSEVIEIERIVKILNDKAHSGRLDYDAFQREIKDRFHTLGFIVDVKWYTTNVDGVLVPEIDIQDRTERRQFDHDRQVHEVTNDLLELGEGGVIHTSPGDFQKPPSHQH